MFRPDLIVGQKHGKGNGDYQVAQRLLEVQRYLDWGFSVIPFWLFLIRAPTCAAR